MLTDTPIEGALGETKTVWGMGSPEGVVTAPFATQYQEFTVTSGVKTLVKVWTKTTTIDNTGWN